MNVRIKLIISKICIALLVIGLLVFPWQDINIVFPTMIIKGKIIIDFKYIIGGLMYMLSFILGIIESYFLKRQRNTQGIKILRKISDSVLIEGVLIALSYYGFINVLVPITLLVVNSFIDGIDVLSPNEKDSKLEVLKKMFLYIGTLMLLFYNLPFEVWGIYVAEILVYTATILSVLQTVLEKIPWNKFRE